MNTPPAHNMSFAAKWRIPETMIQSVCFRQPTMFSYGYLVTHSMSEMLQHPASLLTFQLSVIFLLQSLLYFLLKRLKLQPIVIQTLAGTIIGNLLRTSPKMEQLLLSDEADDVICALTSMAHFFFIFSFAVKTDVSTIKKSGKNAWAIGLLSAAVPLGTMWGMAALIDYYWMYISYGRPPSIGAYSFVHCITQFAVIVALLIDLKILNSDVGRLASSAALINYCIGIAIQYALLCNRLRINFDLKAALKNIVLSAIFVSTTVVLGQGIMRAIVRRTPEGKPVSQAHIHFILALVVLVTVLSDATGLEYRFGPFILGLVVPTGPPLGATLSKKLDPLVMGMLIPMLMTYAGFKIKLGINSFDGGYVASTILIILLNLVLKMAVVVLPARIYKMPYKDAFVVSLILCAKGSIEIGLYTVIYTKKRVNDASYATAVASFLITATVIPYVVRQIYDPSRRYASYQRRDILHAPRDQSELQILTCIHRQDDALATIDFLEVSNLTRASPLSVYVLHLVELVGRAMPLFIDHQQHDARVGRPSSSSYGTQLKHITDMFNYYKKQNEGAVRVQIFTSLSCHKFMYDDICSLAFDKMTSLILLPFHKKWNAKGRVVSDDAVLRAINCEVLQRAPCSVGVLVDRRKVLNSNSLVATKPLYHVAVLFLGGDDDREALALGKQMAESPQIQLTVIRLIPSEGEVEDQWEKMINAELIKEIKYESEKRGNVFVRDEVLKEGSETVSFLRSMESKFELIIVGCRQKKSTLTLGMEEWSECDELGLVGDFLASSDVEGAVSVLVVQQHKLPKGTKGR